MDGIAWLVQRDENVPPGIEWLSREERAILAGHRFAPRRRDWLLGRWTAKQAIAAALEVGPSPSSIAILAAEDGAPEARIDDRPAPVAISLSHRRGVAMCAVAAPDLLLGCDVELAERRPGAFARDYLTVAELELVERWPDSDVAVTVVWSMKECVLKATREGLREDTRVVEARPDRPSGEPGWAGGEAIHLGRERLFRCWWRIEDGVVFTVASDRAVGEPWHLDPALFPARRSSGSRR